MKFMIGMLTVLSLVFPLRAQDLGRDTVDSATSAAAKPYRNPRRALVLGSLIPGAGHIYAGEYLKGFLTYEGTVSTIGLGVMTYIVDNCMFAFTEPCRSWPAWPHQVLGVAVIGVGVWEWISSARDAPRAAARANERHRRRLETISPIIDPFSGPANASQIGVSVRW